MSTPRPNIVYRALNAKDIERLNAGLGLEAKNPAGSWTVGEHVSMGSERSSWTNDPWIATTTDLDVARAFNEQNQFGIVKLDLNKVPGSQVRAWEIYPRVNGVDGFPYHRSIWQQEVSVFGEVPRNAILDWMK